MTQELILHPPYQPARRLNATGTHQSIDAQGSLEEVQPWRRSPSEAYTGHHIHGPRRLDASPHTSTLRARSAVGESPARKARPRACVDQAQGTHDGHFPSLSYLGTDGTEMAEKLYLHLIAEDPQVSK